MKLLDDVKNAPKWWSMRLMAIAALVEVLPQAVPYWSGIIPGDVEKYLTAVLITLAMVARVVKQELKK